MARSVWALWYPLTWDQVREFYSEHSQPSPATLSQHAVCEGSQVWVFRPRGDEPGWAMRSWQQKNTGRIRQVNGLAESLWLAHTLGLSGSLNREAYGSLALALLDHSYRGMKCEPLTPQGLIHYWCLPGLWAQSSEERWRTFEKALITCREAGIVEIVARTGRVPRYYASRQLLSLRTQDPRVRLKLDRSALPRPHDE